MSAADVEVWSVPKSGHAKHENEDAGAAASADWPVHAAVADGATEAAFSRAWARELVQHAVSAGVVAPSESDLQAWRAAWRDRIAPRLEMRPWYVAAKVEEGAYATYLHMQCRANGEWKAACVGDCVLFQLRGDALHLAWPETDLDAFDHRPALISTTPNSVPDVRTEHGTWRPGDRFLLATDAAAAWLLRVGPAEALLWGARSFEDAVASARAAGRLRNDDTTILLLTPHQ